MKPIIIAISGGSGSGKTYLAQAIAKQYPKEKVLIINQDSYYKNLYPISFEERKKQNFDHPSAIDIKLIEENLSAFCKGDKAQIPQYNFKTHLRKKKTKSVISKKIIIIEGILILHYTELRKFYTIKIYIDTPKEICFSRRLERDMKERGRSQESITKQYYSTVEPMYNQFIEPSKIYADLIIKGTKDNSENIKLIKSKINSILL